MRLSNSSQSLLKVLIILFNSLRGVLQFPICVTICIRSPCYFNQNGIFNVVTPHFGCLLMCSCECLCGSCINFRCLTMNQLFVVALILFVSV